jgi:hypothetical protein
VFQVYVESGPIESEYELDRIADEFAANLPTSESAAARGALVGIDETRRSLNFSCIVDANDARLAIIMAASEFEAHLDLLGVTGVCIHHAQADPDRVNTDRSLVRY